ncbi:unnamed protein product [Aphanomyces euteiches]
MATMDALLEDNDIVDNDDEMWTLVCDILLPSSAEASSSLPKAGRTAKKERVYTNKAEVQELQREIRRLQSQLIATKRAFKEKAMTSPWKIAAAHLRVEKNKAQDENNLLRIAVRERNDYIHRLQNLILKTPRKWTALPDTAFEDDTSLVLPIDLLLRAKAIHRIADRQHRRQLNAFVQAGAFDLCEDMCKGKAIMLSNQQIGFVSVNHINLPAPYQLVARASWNVMNGTDTSTPLRNDHETWERYDDRTVYNRYQNRRNGITCHSNVVRKLYEEPNRSVIVWISVSEDAMTTRHSLDAVDEMHGW